MLEEIKRHREMVQQNIIKGFDSDFAEALEKKLFNKGEIEYDEFQKAIYADTYENRKLGRVGREYHRSKDGKKELPTLNRNDRFINDPSLLMPDKPSRHHGGNTLSAQERYKKELEKYILHVSSYPDLKEKAEKELKKINKKIKEMKEEK